MASLPAPAKPAHLKRELGIPAATMMGLGSMIGTGVFVSIGIGAGIAGPAVMLAILLAGLLATCNALSSAQLATNHPVAGGTYEYGYKWIHSSAGFTAGWMFLLAKGASAATAALGFSGYLLEALSLDARWLVPLALAWVFLLTTTVMSGIRHSSRLNIVTVSLALTALGAFVFTGIAHLSTEHFQPFFSSPTGGQDNWASSLLHATALMFVAYTGYGRIATLGEEVHEPRKTIPRAIVVTLTVTALVYLSVALIAIGSTGADAYARATAEQAAPLEVVARSFALPGLQWVVAAGAMAAMLGVLLNLLLGLSRMVMALGRRGDLPKAFARLNAAQTTPPLAVVAVGSGIALLVLIGDVRTTWSFSAFTVLIYYALTNIAALRLSETERLYPRPIAWLGLVSCLGLAFRVEQKIWMIGLLLLGGGLVWHAVALRLRRAAA